jgi:hypothetical protein
LPEEYFPAFEERHPGSLASQWIPMDTNLWKIKNYQDFLVARRELLAAETNRQMEELLHGDIRWLERTVKPEEAAASVAIIESISSEEEETELIALNDWVEAQGLPRGQMPFEYTDPATGEQKAVLDLAWPDGLQEGLSQPVAVLLNEGTDSLRLASSAGFRCFTERDAFKSYIVKEVLGDVQAT